MKSIALLGSTGSIGRQALDVIAGYPDRFQVVSLSAGRQVKLLAEQARRFKPEKVAIADDAQYLELKGALADTPIKVMSGNASLCALAAEDGPSLVLNALVGFAGLAPTLSALHAGKTLALANKESLVAGGALVMSAAAEQGACVLPVDSEHSAIFQCIQGQDRSALEKVILTASGGPFYGFSPLQLSSVTPKQALKHPNWQMGDKISIDSATMMNKGLEVIEAHWLFNLSYERIDVVIHRESIIHSMVQFTDGAALAQLGAPDMRVPIQYALTFPDRLQGEAPRVDWHGLTGLHFSPPDYEAFPCLKLAYDAGRIGGSMPAVLNAANEEAVRLFLTEEVDFLAIPRIIESAMNKHKVVIAPTLEELVEIDQMCRQTVRELNNNERVK